ncbi:MAG: response regulator [Elusimicrobia bacterium]|nr:response regulator [Elusimicrobiota bacterium]
MSDKLVLFVEDNPDDVELTLLAFQQEKFPYKVVVAKDGQEALDFLFAQGEHSGRDRSEMPALVILDLKMPRVGGLEVLKAMREDRWLSYIVAVILTTSDEERDHAEAEKLGANLYFKKPMNFGELCEIVRQIQRLIDP